MMRSFAKKATAADSQANLDPASQNVQHVDGILQLVPLVVQGFGLPQTKSDGLVSLVDFQLLESGVSLH